MQSEIACVMRTLLGTGFLEQDLKARMEAGDQVVNSAPAGAPGMR